MSNTTVITRELIEQSVEEHESFISMVIKNKYGQDTVADVIEGVIKFCDIQEEDQQHLLRSGKFLPAGGILSRCNSEKESSFSNCYFTPTTLDSMKGIYDCQGQLADTFKMRGGSGFDITILRPKNAPVNNAAETSSGAVSFLPLFSETVRVCGQQGRRAAGSCTLDIRHPDSLDFIWCKADPTRVFPKDPFIDRLPDISGINISLKISDSFMRAVEKDEDWVFVFPDIEDNKEFYNEHWEGDYDKWYGIGGKFKIYQTIKAREVLDQIAEAAWMCGDPGIVFINTAQRDTIGSYISEDLKPVGINPCGEQCLAKYNNCLLGAFVLPKYFYQGSFNWGMFKNDIPIATRLMNKFSDINEDKHPLPEQVIADKFGKRIGIEFTGFGDVCASLGFKYGDSDSISLIEDITGTLLTHSIEESIDIAKIQGACDALSTETQRFDFLESVNWQCDIIHTHKEDILKYGMANTAFLTIGPCGTLSIISDNCSSGIEPIFKFSYKRRNRIDNKEYEFIHYPACLKMIENIEDYEGLSLNEAKDKLCYIEASDVDWLAKLDIIASAQQNIDASISSTTNMSSYTTKDNIRDLYIEAWEVGLKGITVFRDGCKEGVLSGIETVEKERQEATIPKCQMFEKELLPIESAERHLARWKKGKIYVNVSLDDEDPLEVFCKLPLECGHDKDGNFNPQLWMERTSQWDLSSRLISMCLRYGISLEEVLKQLDRSSYSMVDSAGILGRILRKYISSNTQDDFEVDGLILGSKCPECGKMSYVNEGGCVSCKECGFSRCG